MGRPDNRRHAREADSECRQVDLLLGHRKLACHGRQKSGQQTHLFRARGGAGILSRQQSKICLQTADDRVAERKAYRRSSRFADLHTADEELWTRFNSSAEQQLWYYSRLADIYRRRRPGSCRFCHRPGIPSTITRAP